MLFLILMACHTVYGEKLEVEQVRNLSDLDELFVPLLPSFLSVFFSFLMSCLISFLCILSSYVLKFSNIFASVLLDQVINLDSFSKHTYS